MLAMWADVVVVAGLAVGGVTADRSSVPIGVLVVSVVVAMTTAVPIARWLRPQVEAVLWSHPDGVSQLPIGPVEGDLAAEIAAQIARRLRLPYVAVLLRDEQPAGTADPARLARIPLLFADEPLGELVAMPRPRDHTLSDADLALLADLAAQIAITLHADRAREAVLRSRAEVITAREEERRRIRRDLHDGLAPTLASLGLHLAAVQQLITRDPDEALSLVDRLRDDIRTTSGLVRELVYDLRPSLLDDVGLAAALTARADELGAARGLRMDVEIDDSLAALPAAVEMALYRVGCEALANVGRHAFGTRCRVRLDRVDDAVVLTVRDDGRGLPLGVLPGVGLVAMRERVDELAGELTLTRGLAGQGAGVTVRFPLRVPV